MKILSDRSSFKLKAQSGPDALLNFLKGLAIENPDIINSLARIPPRKQQSKAVERDGENDIALHPGGRLVVWMG
jgi:hypothetical protein